MYSPDELPDEMLDCMKMPPAPCASSSPLREAVLAQTTGVIRFRRRMKRTGPIAALAGCYLAGLLTMSVWRASVEQRPESSASPRDLAVQSQPKADLQPTRPLVRPEDDGVITGAAAQTTIAKLSPYDRLRRAGDRQLGEENDVAAAARTYRRALKLASPTQRSIAPDQDTWLLMAMKNDQTYKPTEDVQ